MTIKRKAESPLQSEQSPKIRRTSTTSAQDNLLRPSSGHCERDLSRGSPIPAPLTKANLRRFEAMTNHGSKANRSSVTASSSGSGNTAGDTKSRHSTTDADFEARFRANGGLSATHSVHRPPQNEASLQEFLDRSRASASPTPSEWADWTQEVSDLCNERDMENLLEGAIFKDINKDPELKNMRYKSKPDKQWVNFPKDVGFNNGLAPPKPDRTEGYMRSVMPPNIQALGGSATLVKNDTPFVTLPHFAAEVKDWGKSIRQAELQAGFDGAAMVYGRNQALRHMGQPDPPRHAAVVTAVTDGRKWDVYAHYAHENEATKLTEYIQYPMASGDLLKHSDVKRGRKVLRNAQDWGRDNSTDIKNRLQQHYDIHGMGQPQSPVAQTSPRSHAPSGVSSGPISSKGDGNKLIPSFHRSMVPGAPSSSPSAGSGSGVRKHENASEKNAMLPPLSPTSAASRHRADGRGISSKVQATASPLPNSFQYPDVKTTPAPSDGRRPSPVQATVASGSNSYRNQYRDRSPDHRSDGCIKPLQTRRSNSPQDSERQPRQLQRDEDGSSDRSRKDDSRVEGSTGISSTTNTKVSTDKVTVKAPPRPSIFRKVYSKKPKPVAQD